MCILCDSKENWERNKETYVMFLNCVQCMVGYIEYIRVLYLYFVHVCENVCVREKHERKKHSHTAKSERGGERRSKL